MLTQEDPRDPLLHRLKFRKELEALAASPQTPVLVEGFGARQFAQHLHEMTFPSGCAPFVSVDCTWLPSQKTLSLLFGEEQSGRVHHGLVERADGGTLFLEDIAELPSAAQARLAQFLDQSRLRRVGGAAAVEVHVRVVASAPGSLDRLVKSGRFRRDLHSRLSILPVILA